MRPSLLADLSAPMAVSVVPSALASSALRAACAGAVTAAARTAASSVIRVCMDDSSEGGAEGQADEAPVLQEGGEAVLRRHGAAVVAVAADVVDVLQVDAVFLLHVGRDADGVVAQALVAAEHGGRIARDADRVGHRRRQVDARKDLEPARCEGEAHADIVLGGAAIPLVPVTGAAGAVGLAGCIDRKSTRLNSSHSQ